MAASVAKRRARSGGASSPALVTLNANLALDHTSAVTGNLILNGANTYSGGTTLDGGTTILGNKQAFGVGTGGREGRGTHTPHGRLGPTQGGGTRSALGTQ